MTIIVHRAGRLVAWCLGGAAVGHLTARYLPAWAQIVVMVAGTIWMLVLLRQLYVAYRQIVETRAQLTEIEAQLDAQDPQWRDALR